MSRSATLTLALLAVGGCKLESSAVDPPPAADAATPADAAQIDAPLGSVQTLTFGERPDSDVQGVTFDHHMIENQPTTGCGQCGGINGGGSEAGLVKFDLTTIAPGSQIMSAEIELYINALFTLGGTDDIFVVREEWTEGTASMNGVDDVPNWIERAAGVNWASPGVGPDSRDPSPILSAEPVSLDQPFTIPIPAAIAQEWIDDPSTNQGIVIRGRDFPGAGGDHPHFFSSEAGAEPTRRPQLRVQYRE